MNDPSTPSRSLTPEAATFLTMLARTEERTDDLTVSYADLRAKLFTPHDSPAARREWQRLESEINSHVRRHLVNELLARMATIDEYFDAGRQGKAETLMAAVFYLDYLRANRVGA